MSLFRPPKHRRQYQGGAESFTVVQQTPDSGAVTNARVGSGAASGRTTFTLRGGSRWLLPSETYFRLQVLITGGGAGLNNCLINRQLTYAENWPSALFSAARLYLNGALLEETLFPAITDTAAKVSGAQRGWLQSFASGGGYGESWSQRIAQLAPRAIATAAAGGNDSLNGQATATIEACFRPPSSFWNTAYSILGNEWRCEFVWDPQGEYGMVDASTLILPTTEAICVAQNAPGVPAAGIAPGNAQYTCTVQAFDMFVATTMPMPETPLPKMIPLDLSPIQCQQQQITTNQSTFNFTVRPSTYRIGFVWQRTSQAGLVSSYSATRFGIPPELKAFRWNSAELGLQAPNPDYAFSGAVASVSRQGAQGDLRRAYMDFCQASQGQNGCDEGSLPFGEFPVDSKLPNQSRWQYYAVPSDGKGVILNVAGPVGPAGALTELPVANNGAQGLSVYCEGPGDGSGRGWLGANGMLLFNVFKPAGGRISNISVTQNLGTPTGAATPDYTMYVLTWSQTYGEIEYDERMQVVRTTVQIDG